MAKIIDFHTHVYPKAIAQKATQSICDFYELGTDLVGTPEVLLERGKEAGISEFVLLPVAVKPERVRSINQFIVQQVAEHKEFYGFGTLHADMDNMNEEIDYMESVGLKGIKIHPDFQKFPIDDERLFPVYDRIQGSLPIIFHCGDYRYDFSSPERLARILKEFPKLTVIAAHLGGWSVYEEAFELLKNQNCYFDISSSMSFISTEQMNKYVHGYGTEKLVFGSDFPLGDPVKEIEYFEKLDLTPYEREQIAFRNAEVILNVNK